MLLLLLAVFAGCGAAKFQRASDAADTAMAQAEWGCQQEWRSHVRGMAAATTPDIGFGIGVALSKRSFMTDCMKAKGYEVAK